MRIPARAIWIAVFLAVGLLAIATVVRSQGPETRPGGEIWEYASVTSTPKVSRLVSFASNKATSEARICYASAQGCRMENVRTTSDKTLEGGDATMAAAARLGEQGWELISATESAFVTHADAATDSHVERVLYFRRLKR